MFRTDVNNPQLADRASVTVAAIGMTVLIGGSLGGILLLARGLVGTAASGTSRTVIKLNGHKSVVAAERIRRLAKGLEVRK
jgi:hypothetical protein